MSESSKLKKNVEPAKNGAARATMAGAVVAAIAASACCVVPAILALVGISGVGAAAVLAPYRPLLLGATAALLGLGFYLAYRKPRTAAAESGAEDACGCPAPRTRRSGKWMLWLAAVGVVFFAAYPYIAAATAATEKRGDTAETVASQTAVLHVDGMTCESCVAHIIDKLTAVPGVVNASVAFDDQSATVTYDPAQVQPDALASAVNSMDSYTAKVISQ